MTLPTTILLEVYTVENTSPGIHTIIIIIFLHADYTFEFKLTEISVKCLLHADYNKSLMGVWLYHRLASSKF